MVDSKPKDPDAELEFDPLRVYEFTTEMKNEADLVLSKEPASSFQPMIKRRLEIEAAKNWDIFYKNNTTNFYKDRHYLLREFVELEQGLNKEQSVVLLDLGCGVGNAFWPVFEKYNQKISI